jgi:hypothetical protein
MRGNNRDNKDLLPILRKTVELQPALDEARLMLGHALYQEGTFIQALIALRQVKVIEPDRAAQLFGMMAYAAYRSNLEKDAKGYAEQSLQYAKTADEKLAAQRLLDYLAGPRAVVAAAPPTAPSAVEQDKPDEAPALRRRGPEAIAPAERPPLPKAAGRLIKLECLGESARAHVRTGTGTQVLLIRRPGEVTIKSGNGASVNMSCGDQNTPVVVEYEATADAKFGTVGDVRTLEFTGN